MLKNKWSQVYNVTCLEEKLLPTYTKKMNIYVNIKYSTGIFNNLATFLICKLLKCRNYGKDDQSNHNNT